MRKNKFSVGDVVQLKSGGPKMTVTSIPTMEHHAHYGCQWWDYYHNSNSYGFISFPEDAIDLYSEPVPMKE